MDLNKIIDKGHLKIPENPLMFFLDLTQRCNLNCWFCYKDFDVLRKDAEFNDVLKILDIMVNVGCNEVMYLGGEPTIYPFFFDVLDYANRLGLVQSFISNGQLIDNSFAKKLKVFPSLEVGISIHSSRCKVQNEASGSKNSFQNILRAIHALRSNGIIWYSQTSLLKSNYRHLRELYDFLNMEGPPLRMDLSRMVATNNQECNLNFLTENEYIEVFSQLNELDNNTLPIRIEAFPRCWLRKIAVDMNLDYSKLKKIVRPCYAWIGQVSIDIYGNVRLCPTGGISAGNILRENFKDIWNGAVIRYFQSFGWHDKKCISCEDFAFCVGACKMTCGCSTPTPDRYIMSKDI